MDPNAALRDLNLAITERDFADAKSICSELDSWLIDGGFAPDWTTYPLATDYFNYFIGQSRENN